MALAAGCFLLGYGYAEWWQPREFTQIEGLVWQFTNAYTLRRDVYYDRTPKPRAEYEVRPFGEFADWPREASIRVSHYRERLPARSADIGLEGLADITPAFTTLAVHVEPGPWSDPATRDTRGMIRQPAQYVLRWGNDAFLFRAANEWEAERTAKSIIWEIIQEFHGGDVEAFAGRRQ